MKTALDGEGTITLRGAEIKVKYLRMKQRDLKYYRDNPRIYSLLFGDDDPTQDEIERTLTQMDHVKLLVRSIKANGGLLDPLVVREKHNVVLEGNSRLAAYRLLARSDAITWGKVKCKLLPHDVTDADVFALLGEYHIVGRKDWAPFEQAGYLWRRHKEHGVSARDMSDEMGLGVGEINQLIAVYDFMREKSDGDAQHWSYYHEYLKSYKIKRARGLREEMDNIIANKIKAGEIKRAADVRDKVSTICAKGGKALTKLLGKGDTLEAAYEQAVAGGANNVILKRLKKFRTFAGDPDTMRDVRQMPQGLRNSCEYELKKIKSFVASLHNAVTGKRPKR